MKRNWMTMLVVAGSLSSNLFGQQYPQQYPQQGGPYQSDPYGDDRYNDDRYGNNDGIYAPPPPSIPRYAYNRPPMPGPGFYWVDGYWNFQRRRYVWVNGYWARPPYAGGYWVAPRYNSGRYFLGFWGGPRSDFNRGYRNSYRFNGNHRGYR
ncbi:MAG: hypothetical protein NTW74_25570 [Acidobacteria bacterium]|nr:hypothetical protein [Acidobacteriota bacterium]